MRPASPNASREASTVIHGLRGCTTGGMSLNYQVAGRVLDTLLRNHAGLKSLLFGQAQHLVGSANKRAVYALVCQTLKYRTVILQCMQGTALAKVAKVSKNRAVILIMVYEMLFGKGKIHGGGALRRAVLENESVLRSRLARQKQAASASTNEDLLPDIHRTILKLPRFVRVNTLKTTVEAAVERLHADGIEANVDEHIPSLLVVPPDTELFAHDLVCDGSLIIQDKASCFPAYVLLQGCSDAQHVIDACAAPGNKTTHLAALLGKGALVEAYERDAKRFSTLEQRVKSAGADDIIRCVCSDFRSCQPTNSTATAILIDPTCSSSGLAHHRIEASLQSMAMTPSSLQDLHRQQVDVILHAMRFPLVERITYSTCSIHRIENEDVVQEVLRRCSGRFELAEALPGWPGRGLPVFPHAERCIRSSPALGTHGFFVALFVRRQPVCPAPAASTENAHDADHVGKPPAAADVRSVRRQRKKARCRISVKRF
ncbi:hypothetical protein PBRA_005482 [Plasmodiophora brassicae]|nr:hypothetical protein PBRA_005482 [Plasmodiophora brassicae]